MAILDKIDLNNDFMSDLYNSHNNVIDRLNSITDANGSITSLETLETNLANVITLEVSNTIMVQNLNVEYLANHAFDFFASNAELQSLTNAFVILDNNFDDLSSNVAINAANISDLQSNVTTIAGNLSDAQANIAQLQDDLANVVGFVSYEEVQSLTANQMQVARENIYAASQEVLSFPKNLYYVYSKNILQNASMEISQEFGNSVISATNQHPVDRWKINYILGTGNINGFKNNNTPFPEYPQFLNSVRVGTNGVEVAVGGSEWASFRQVVEGAKMRDLRWGTSEGIDLTIGQVVRSNANRKIFLKIHNHSGNRQYLKEFDLQAGNTQLLQAIIPAELTAGTSSTGWPTDNVASMHIVWVVDCGSGPILASLDQWHTAGEYYGNVQTNSFCSNSQSYIDFGPAAAFAGNNEIYLPPIEDFHRIAKDYDTELMACQRYYQRFDELVWTASVTSGHSIRFPMLFPVEFRVAPTASMQVISNNAITSPAVQSITTKSFALFASASVTGNGYLGANVTFSAKL